MAAGKQALLNSEGKTNANDALVVTGGATSTPGPASTLANKEVVVDSSNRLVVQFR